MLKKKNKTNCLCGILNIFSDKWKSPVNSRGIVKFLFFFTSFGASKESIATVQSIHCTIVQIFEHFYFYYPVT